MSFHNTNNESGAELKASINNARHQEEIILEYFKLHPDKEFTPFEIQGAVGLVETPITSIRRAMTNLTSDDKLIKTDNQRVGQYGKKNYCWRLSISQPDPQPVPEKGWFEEDEMAGSSGNPNIYKILEQEKKFQASISTQTEQSEVVKSKEDKQQKLF